MKKLKAQEIIEILKKHSTVSSFCNDEFFLEIPKDFKFSDEIAKKEEAHIKAYNEWIENGNSWEKDNIYFQNWQNNPEPFKNKFEEFSNYLGLGKTENVDSYGGEDCGSTYYSVIHFIDHDVYLKVSGWYQSHYGTDFGPWNEAVKEVSPKTKTITVFE